MTQLVNVGTILKDPNGVYNFDQLNTSSVFNDDITIEEGKKVIFPFSEVNGSITIRNITNFQASTLQSIKGILSIRNIKTVSLPCLKQCDLIITENVQTLDLPQLSQATMIVVDADSVNTSADGTLYHYLVKNCNCPNMKIKDFLDNPVFIIDGSLYHSINVNKIDDNTYIHHLTNENETQNYVKLLYKNGVIGITAKTEEEALQILKEELKIKKGI